MPAGPGVSPFTLLVLNLPLTGCGGVSPLKSARLATGLPALNLVPGR